MSITSRITSMEEHISEAYDELQGLGADLTNVNKNIENISSVLDTIYDSMPQVSGEGTTLSLDNTRVGKIKSTLKGNTSQNGTPTPSSPIPVNVVSGNNSVVVQGKNFFDNIIEPSEKSASVSKSVISTGVRIQYTGSTSTTGSYDYSIFVVKDLTDYVGKTLRVKANFTPSSNNIGFVIVGLCNQDGTNRSNKGNISTSGGTFSLVIPTLSGNQTYLYIGIYANANGTRTPNCYVDYTNLIITIDNEDMTYEPYTETTYPINLPEGMELCKIGNYQDYFLHDKTLDKWYLHKEVGKDAIKNLTIMTYTSSIYGIYFYFRLPNMVYNASKIYSRIYEKVAISPSTWVDGTVVVDGINTQVRDSRFSTKEEFKAGVGDEYFYFPISPTTDTEITYQPLIEQLNNLEKAMSYNGQTNISQVNNDLPFVISASALKDWQESNTSTLSMVNPLSLGNTLNTQENDIQSIEVDNIEPLEEGNYEENQESI